MIRLAEFQAKKLLSIQGIRIPDGKEWEESSGPIQLDVSKEWMLKAQVGVGGRFKKGLIVQVANPARLDRLASKIFKRAKKFGGCRFLLAEERIPHKKEMYLAVFSDPLRRCPLIVYGSRGGVEVERLFGRSSKSVFYPVDILEGYVPEKMQKALSAGGVRGLLNNQLCKIAGKVYQIYRQWDCRLVEINPLVDHAGELWALDAKMELDEDALYRLEALVEEAGICLNEDGRRSVLEEKAARIDHRDYRGSAHFVQNDVAAARKRHGRRIRAVVGFNGIGTGASLTAMDELVRLGFFPRNFCDTSGNPPASKLYRITKIILQQEGIQGYFFISCMSSQQLDHTARGIIKAFKEHYANSFGVPGIPALFHFRGAWDGEAKTLFAEHGIAQSERVAILGRESTERQAAEKFKRLYESFRQRN